MPKPSASTGDVKIDFKFLPAQLRLFHYVTRGLGTYLQTVAPQCLDVGGIRSGKTLGKLMYGIQNYCLRFEKCDMLVLRRTFSELDSGVIQDFKTFVPKELYDFNQSTRVATFKNGSRIVFAGCVNNQLRDIEKYLGQSYPFILVDECGQFAPAAWYLLYTRNLVNAGCKEDEFGNTPIPTICGCTNPLGPYWEFYHTIFVKKEPWDKEDKMLRAKDGSWWRQGIEKPELAYNPADYAYAHTTILDNPIYCKRDPGRIAALKALPPALRKKHLEGLMDVVAGQYFDCFSPQDHVVSLRDDPEGIIWQDWQPVWGGQDFGLGHWNAIYLFTKALVRTIGSDYQMKTVCFQEIAPETIGHSDIQLADMLSAKAYYPRLPEGHPQFERISGKRCKVRSIYFSHEKFNRSMDLHSPADTYSRLLQERGLPHVTRATTDRIGSGAFMYNQLKTGKLVILDSCPGIIAAIPSLQRDAKNLDDVEKTDSRSDDRYDAFRYGLFGELNPKGTPKAEKDRLYADTLDSFARHFYLQKQRFNQSRENEVFLPEEKPFWMSKI